MGHLQGKSVVVTGAARGLGRAYAEALAAAGAGVVLNDVDGDALEEVVTAIIERGAAAASVVGAVGEKELADALTAAAVENFGRLDVFVANAGVLRDKTVTRMSDEDFDLVVRTHVRGAFTGARSAFQRFRDQGDGGRIILIGSPAGQRASFGQANYSAAKAAIVGLTRTLAAEGERHHIDVNVVIPVALTRMTATIPGLEPVVSAVEAGGEVPQDLRRSGFGTPADVAPLVVYLASDAAAGVTGQAFGIGGDKVSLWSHPEEVAVAIRDGGWTVEALVSTFPNVLANRLQDFRPFTSAEA